MSREDYELSEQPHYDGLLGRGAGDPDFYGYPGEPVEAPTSLDGLYVIDQWLLSCGFDAVGGKHKQGK